MNSFTLFAIISSAVLIASAQCPEKNGRFPVSGQCDAYIECVDGVAEEKLCPDGLSFDETAKFHTYPCKYPIDVDCGVQTRFQTPQSTDDCPHQFGYYRVGDETHCGQFKNCANGDAYVFDCPDGLAFNSETYQCDWPDLVGDCDEEAFLGYKCPEGARSEGLGQEKQRFYKSPHDCQHYFACYNGKPRRFSCGEDYAFNELIQSCDGVENVTGCALGTEASNSNSFRKG